MPTAGLSEEYMRMMEEKTRVIGVDLASATAASETKIVFASSSGLDLKQQAIVDRIMELEQKMAEKMIVPPKMILTDSTSEPDPGWDHFKFKEIGPYVAKKPSIPMPQPIIDEEEELDAADFIKIMKEANIEMPKTITPPKINLTREGLLQILITIVKKNGGKLELDADDVMDASVGDKFVVDEMIDQNTLQKKLVISVIGKKSNKLVKAKKKIAPKKVEPQGPVPRRGIPHRIIIKPEVESK